MDEITQAVLSLESLSERGRPLGEDVRELVISFGRYAYVAEYRVDPDAVIVSRIRHSHELQKS